MGGPISEDAGIIGVNEKAGGRLMKLCGPFPHKKGDEPFVNSFCFVYKSKTCLVESHVDMDTKQNKICAITILRISFPSFFVNKSILKEWIYSNVF